MALLITLAVLLGLTFLPLGFRAVYRETDSGVWMLIGPLKFRIYPGKPKKEKEKPEQTHEPKKGSSKGGSYRDFLPLIPTILDFLDQLHKKIRVKHLEVKLTLAGDDPCDLAVNYGRAWAALGNLMPHLERVFVIQKRNLDVTCDFAAEKTLIFVRLDVTITLGRTLYLLSKHGVKVLKEFFELKKLRKGGASL